MEQGSSEKGNSIGSIVSGTVSSFEVMDAKRATTVLQDFLVKLDQAREWVCAVTEEHYDISMFKEELPKAELLARVVQRLDPGFVARIHSGPVREYKHVDNIMLFLNWLRKIKLRKHFFFETVDLYESKNIPKVIYCIHGLASFLSRRGMGEGIVVRDNIVFTYQETSLFSEDINNIKMQKFDDIQAILDSEEPRDQSSGDTWHRDDAAMRHFGKCLVWRRAFRELVYEGGASVGSIKKFIDFDLSNEQATRTIGEQQHEIIQRFKENYEKEVEKDGILRTVRLLLENQAVLRQILVGPYPLANDYTGFKRALYMLMHNYGLFFNILSSGFELPLRVIFPDTAIGDFHFSNVIRKNLFRDSDKLVRIARSHFVTSRTFKNLTEAFSSSQDFDLNPVAVSLYLEQHSEGGCKRAMLDDAIGDEEVRKEILRRSHAIIGFVRSKYEYLVGIDLPYYVRFFVDSPVFYESFIEPAILCANNYVVAELFRFILSDDGGDVCSAGEQERMYLSGTRFERTTSFDLSDYSPLRDFLDQCRQDPSNYRAGLCQKHRIELDIDDHFMDCVSSRDVLQVEINIEEINNIIIVLKQNLELMSGEMRDVVADLALVRSPHPSEYKIEMLSRVGDVVTDAPIHIDGKVSGMSPLNAVEKYKEITASLSSPPEDAQLLRERFVLRLDNQFDDHMEEDDLAMRALLRDLKYRVMLLITITDQTDLDSILDRTTPSEIECIGKNGLDAMEIETIKKTVRNDIAFLEGRSIIKRSGGGNHILEMIANDVLMSKYRLLKHEISLNAETSDALFQKGVRLNSYLQYLYRYVRDLSDALFVNKSRILFNPQVEPYSRYGTYKIALEDVRAQVYENIDVSRMFFTISCKQPMVLDIEVFYEEDSICDPKVVRFDELLRLREDCVMYFDVNEVCCFSVGSLIAIINEKYINY